MRLIILVVTILNLHNMFYAIQILNEEKRRLNQEAIRILKTNKCGMKGHNMSIENQKAIDIIDNRVNSIDQALKEIKLNREAA